MYSLRTVLPDRDNDGIPEVGDVVRGGAKTSFCLIDVQQFSTTPSLPNAAPERSGFGCDTQQQISVGWEDVYSAYTEGQEINVAGLEAGDYWLEATVDPDNHFLEKDETNNTGRVLIHLGSAQPMHRVTVDPGTDLRGLDFANFQQINVSGSVFSDANGNGCRDAAEIPLASVAVFIDTNGDHILNNPTSGDGVADGLAQEPWALTDANGNFQFAGLSGGQYQVRVVAPYGLIQTTETPPRISAVSGHDLNVGAFGFGSNAGATTQVRLADDGHIVISDIAIRGQNDQLTVSVEGFQFSPEQQTPQVRIHDPKHILTTSIGVQEGLHTIFVPITEAISSNLIEINVGDGDDVVSVNLGASPGVALINGGAGKDAISITGGLRLTLFSGDDHGDLASQIHDHDHTGEDRISAMLDEFGLFTTSTINGGSGNDRIVATFSSLGVILNGDSGNDSIVGGAGDDCLQGGQGDDTLAGGSGADVLSGGDGADQLRGDSGMDTLQGNAGNDLLEGGEGDDLFRLISGDDRDVISGGQGFDTITVEGTPLGDTYRVGMTSSQVRLQKTNSSAALLTVDVRDGESLLVRGLAGNDRLELGAIAAMNIAVSFDGGLGEDTLQLNGTPNRDRWSLADFDHPLIVMRRGPAVANVSAATEHVLVNLGGGNDVFNAEGVFAPEVQITVRGESGDDTITGGAGRDSLLGGVGNDFITGGAGNDRLFGENGNDSLFGGEGSDLLVVSDGDDQLDGQAGSDLLVGGSGRNTFINPADGEIITAFNVNLQRLLDQI
jgi:Ca2+-binding RTX toxin-like protein